jgi:hypothetical protein
VSTRTPAPGSANCQALISLARETGRGTGMGYVSESIDA